MKLSKISTLLLVSLFALAGCNGEEENEGENGGEENGGTTENTNGGGDNGTVLKNYTLEFNIYKVSDGVRYSQITNYGMMVYITGDFPGFNWGGFTDENGIETVGKFEALTSSGSTEEDYRYSITFDEISAGTYSYKLTLNTTDYPGWYNEVTEENLVVDIKSSDGDGYTQQIDVENELDWFNQIWPAY